MCRRYWITLIISIAFIYRTLSFQTLHLDYKYLHEASLSTDNMYVSLFPYYCARCTCWCLYSYSILVRVLNADVYKLGQQVCVLLYFFVFFKSVMAQFFKDFSWNGAAVKLLYLFAKNIIFNQVVNIKPLS
jgi:hypothetical protein